MEVKNSIAFLTDSTAGFSLTELAEYPNLFVLPICLVYPNDKIVMETNENFNEQEFNNWIKQKKLIKTTHTSIAYIINTFQELLKKYHHIVYIGLSSFLSPGQYQTINHVIKRYQWEKKIIIIDSKCISMLLKQMVIYTYRNVTNQSVALDFQKKIPIVSSDNVFYFIVQDYEYLVASGRIPQVISNFLKSKFITPICTLKKGKITLIKKKRTLKKSIEWILQNIWKKSPSELSIFSNLPTEDPSMIVVKQLLDNYQFLKIIWAPIPKSIICHTGAQTMIFSGKIMIGGGGKNRTHNN